jgi:histidinol-phosphate aminotransferase
VAQAAAVASLGAEQHLLARVAQLVGERRRVTAELARQGWQVPDAQGNFVWLALGERTLEFAAACEDRGVSVRPFAGEGARVSIGEVEANDLFLSVAAEFV